MRSCPLAVLFLPVLLLPVPAYCAQTPLLAPAEAIHHVGQQATVCGRIAATRRASTVHGLPTLIDLSQTLPNPAFTIILWDSDRSKIGNFPSFGNVCVTGIISQYKGVPQMVVEDAKSWSFTPTPIPGSRPPGNPVLRANSSIPTPPVAPPSATHPPAATPPAARVDPSPVPAPPVPARPAAPSRVPAPPLSASPPASSRVAASPAPAASSPVPAPPVSASPPASSRVAASPAPAAPSPVASPSIPPSPLPPSYRIGADDSLQITVWKEPNLSGTFLVRPDGMISMVLAGEVRAAGLTPLALAADLTERFKKYLQDPLVSVIVVAPNSQKIYLLGEVQHVGPVPMATAMSPLQAIAAAGGLTPYAKEKKIYILRGPQGSQHKIPFNYKSALNAKPGSSVHLLAGDTIVVP